MPCSPRDVCVTYCAIVLARGGVWRVDDLLAGLLGRPQTAQAYGLERLEGSPLIRNAGRVAPIIVRIRSDSWRSLRIQYSSQTSQTFSVHDDTMPFP